MTITTANDWNPETVEELVIETDDEQKRFVGPLEFVRDGGMWEVYLNTLDDIEVGEYEGELATVYNDEGDRIDYGTIEVVDDVDDVIVVAVDSATTVSEHTDEITITTTDSPIAVNEQGLDGAMGE